MRDPFVLNGNSYDFAHLASFTVTVPSKKEGFAPAKLVVTFSHHVFSQQWDDDLHTIDLAITEDGEKRAFCMDRYGWSKDLAAIVRYHVAGKAFSSRDGNGNWNHFFYEQRNGRAVPYPVYFRIGKASKIAGVDGLLHVISAYENVKLLPMRRLQSIKFDTLVSQHISFKELEM